MNRDRLLTGQPLRCNGHEREFFQMTLRLVLMKRGRFMLALSVDRIEGDSKSAKRQVSTRD
jgi:hypothetical protein